MIDLASVDLKSNSIYHLSVEAVAGGSWELLVLDAGTGAVIQRVAGGERDDRGLVEAVFKTSQQGRVRLAIRGHKMKREPLLPIARVSVREIAEIKE